MPRLLKHAAPLLVALVICCSAAADVTGHRDPLSLLQSDDAALASNKRLVFDLWRGIVNAGHVELADELLAEDYTQHSPVLPTGRAAFKQIFSAVPRRDEIPELVEPPLVALVAEGPFVVMVLAETVADPGGSGSYTAAHFNLFRVENGRLAEHWHSVQTAPGPDVAPPDQGGPQPVTGRTGNDQYALLGAADAGLAINKRLVFDVARQIVDAGREELAEIYLAEDYVDHTPDAAPGRDAFRARTAAQVDRPIRTDLRAPLVAMLAEGDLVVQVTMQEHPHPVRDGATYTTTWFDMYRVADARVIEHWDPSLRAARGDACASDGALEYLCGPENAEDIVAVGGTRWLIASSITTRGQSVGPGRLYLIDSRANTFEPLFPGASPVLRPDPATSAAGCDSVDLEAFDTHGLDLRQIAPNRYRLYATSHGAREAIQTFELDTSGDRPAIAWTGCVELPPDAWANSVAILDDGGFVATRFMDPRNPDAVAGILAGEVSGAVLEWHPGGTVAEVPGTGLSGPNGIAQSPDGRYLFVAAFGSRRVVRFERTGEPRPPLAIDLDIAPDNLRWTGHGTLLTVGSKPQPDGGWTVIEIDPDSMRATPLVDAGATVRLRGPSTALEVSGEIWIGTPGGDRVGRIPVR